jgi:chemotaxis protein methyltransferase CheR
MNAMSPTQFDYLREMIHRESAIVLDLDKEYLVESRLAPIARREGLASVADLVQRLLSKPMTSLRAQVVDAMTTNETSFYRDVHPWQTLRAQILPDLIAARAASQTLNIWCAACSSGQEPYSLAMLLLDEFPQLLAEWNIRIVATDLSTTMVERSQAGTFSQLEVNRGLTEAQLQRHFVKTGSSWQISDRVRQMVEVHAANLAVPSSIPRMGGIDLVLLRNVLIYFDAPTQREIVSKVARHIKPGGLLCVGLAESLHGHRIGFEHLELGMYRRGAA